MILFTKLKSLWETSMYNRSKIILNGWNYIYLLCGIIFVY